MQITSSQNNSIKRLRALYKDKKLRKETGLFIAEGINLVKDIPATFCVKELFITCSKYDELSYLATGFAVEPYVVSDSIFKAVSDTVTPSGVIALIKLKDKPKSPMVDGDIVLVLDGISDAGNMGTIIRSAAARGIKSVICVNCTDPYSPKAVRAAMGGTFRTSIIETDIEKLDSLLTGYTKIGLDMSTKCIFEYKKSGKIALIVGNEAHGLSSGVRAICNEFLSIPMENGVESLNAAVSISIAMFIIR